MGQLRMCHPGGSPVDGATDHCFQADKGNRRIGCLVAWAFLGPWQLRKKKESHGFPNIITRQERK
jgi:hypothetical protein